MGYKGYFRSLRSNTLYSVIIKKSEYNGPLKEIILAGDRPFVVKYNESATPFDPIRNSTATIQIVSNQYLEDILPSAPHETQVILRKEEDADGNFIGTNVWVGYLTPKVYSQGYEDEYETIEFEASDVVSSLQYIDYKPLNDNRGITTFKDIIVNIIDNTLLKGFKWANTKIYNSAVITPDQLKISVQNFFSNDTDEPWDCQKVLEEMSKYLGFTCVQSGEFLYFADYTALSTSDTFSFLTYPKSSNYSQTTTTDNGGRKYVTEKNIMGNGETISFEPIYNKIVVKDTFYTCEDFITNIFDDNALTNRGGDFYSSFEVIPLEDKPRFPNGSSWFHQKYVTDADDKEYRFFHRLYDHKDFQSIYRNSSLMQTALISPNNSDATRNYIGGTIMDLGVVKKDYYDDDVYQYIVSSNINWERYLCINQMGQGWGPFNGYTNYYPTSNMVIFKLKDDYTSNVMLNDESYIIINYSILFEKYEGRNYINPEWGKDKPDMSSWENGMYSETSGVLAFKFGIGNKFWNGQTWQDTSTYFTIETAKEEKFAVVNESREVLNNVSWVLNIDEEGYKIPLKGIDTTGKVVFEILLPRLQMITDFDGLNPTKYNAYCWLKDFSIKSVTKNKDKEAEESDVVYENVIDDININEINDIECKFTTYVEGTQPSYSNVIINRGEKNEMLKTISEVGLGYTEQKPEENIIERYYNQYSTPTKKLSYTLDTSFGIFNKYYGVDIDNPNTGYVQLSTEIDYSRDKQEIILIEKK